MNHLGIKIKELREKRKFLLRQVAAHLECDTALISKVERGERNLSREQIEKLAFLFRVEAEELITLWLAEKVIHVIGDDPLAERGVKRALNNLKSLPHL
ncbi:MAG: helix-turn-helix domain-containing protein [Bacteroidia bacterium]